MWSYDDLAIFVGVVERGSFIAAAKKMKIPSSTVSRRLSCLEADLGVKLLERTSRKIHLTEKGKLFYEQCSSQINQLGEHAKALTASIDDIHGKLKITAPTYVGNEVMADLFTDFVKQNPGIELELLLSNGIEDILDEEIDVAIRVGPLESSSLIAQYLWEMPKKLEDIEHHHSLIFKTQEIPLHFRRLKTAEEYKINVKSRLVSNDIKFTIHAVSNGAGIAFLPRMFIREQLESGILLELLPEYELMNRKVVYAVYPSKRYLPKKTQLLIKYIKEKSHLLNRKK